MKAELYRKVEDGLDAVVLVSTGEESLFFLGITGGRLPRHTVQTAAVSELVSQLGDCGFQYVGECVFEDQMVVGVDGPRAHACVWHRDFDAFRHKAEDLLGKPLDWSGVNWHDGLIVICTTAAAETAVAALGAAKALELQVHSASSTREVSDIVPIEIRGADMFKYFKRSTFVAEESASAKAGLLPAPVRFPVGNPVIHF